MSGELALSGPTFSIITHLTSQITNDAATIIGASFCSVHKPLVLTLVPALSERLAKVKPGILTFSLPWAWSEPQMTQPACLRAAHISVFYDFNARETTSTFWKANLPGIKKRERKPQNPTKQGGGPVHG
jgi:hypothetical protein